MTSVIRVYRDASYEAQAKKNISCGACPHCGLLKKEWVKSRGRNHITCSTACTVAYNSQLMSLTWANIKTQVFERDKWVCNICGRKVPQSRLDAVSIVPVQDKQQLFNLSNLKTVCKNCNMNAKIRSKAKKAKSAVRKIEVFDQSKQMHLEV